jgi:hypothetical protein
MNASGPDNSPTARLARRFEALPVVCCAATALLVATVFGSLGALLAAHTGQIFITVLLGLLVLGPTSVLADVRFAKTRLRQRNSAGKRLFHRPASILSASIRAA